VWDGDQHPRCGPKTQRRKVSYTGTSNQRLLKSLGITGSNAEEGSPRPSGGGKTRELMVVKKRRQGMGTARLLGLAAGGSRVMAPPP